MRNASLGGVWEQIKKTSQGDWGFMVVKKEIK